MFASLSEKLSQAFKKFKSKGKLTEADVRAGMREVKMALLEADVNFKVVKEFTKKVTERAVGEEVLESLLPAQQPFLWIFLSTASWAVFPATVCRFP